MDTVPVDERAALEPDAPGWTAEDTERALRAWEEYRQFHDISACIGQTAGIEPRSGRVWFGESIPDVLRQRDAEGIDAPLFAVRVGYDYYYRKGSARP